MTSPVVRFARPQPASVDVIEDLVQEVGRIQVALRNVGVSLAGLATESSREQSGLESDEVSVPEERAVVTALVNSRFVSDDRIENASAASRTVMDSSSFAGNCSPADSKVSKSMVSGIHSQSECPSKCSREFKFHKFWTEIAEDGTNSAQFSVCSDSIRRHTWHLRNLNASLSQESFASSIARVAMCTFHPHSPHRVSWDVLGSLFVAYDAIMLPMLTFDFDRTPLKPIELICSTFWTLDILVCIRTGFTSGARVLTEPWLSAKHYLSTWFLPDVALCVLDWATTLTSIISAGGVHTARVYRLFRIFQIGKVIRLAKLTKKLQRGLKGFASAHKKYFIQLCNVLLMFGMIVHVFTCGWYAVGSSFSGGWVHNSDIDADNADNDIIWQYAQAARFVLAQINGRTDQKPGRTKAEVLYICLCGCFSALFMAYFIGALTSKLVAVQKIIDERHGTPSYVTRYLERHGEKVSWKLIFFVRKHMRDQRELQNHAADEKQLCNVLPEYVAHELFYEVRAPTLLMHALFKTLSVKQEHQPLLRHLCWCAVVAISFPGASIIFHKGESCNRMLFVERGQMRYSQRASFAGLLKKSVESLEESETWSGFFTSGLSALSAEKIDSKITQSAIDSFEGHFLGPGSWVSEAALWIIWTNKGDLVTDRATELFAITAEDFGSVASKHPRALSPLSVYARNFVDRLDIGSLSDL